MRRPRIEALTFDRLSFPEDVIVETHSYCNLSCIMCPYPNLKRPKGEMDLAVFEKIVNEIAAEVPKSRIWMAIMGEPLLGKNLIKMIRYAKQRGVKSVNLNTNATFLSKEMTRELLEAEVDTILVSLDARTQAAYDKIRIGGDFPTVMKNLTFFLKEKRQQGHTKPDVVAQFIIMEQNEHEVEAFKDFWLSRGVIVKVRLKLGWGDAVSTEDLDVANIKRDFPCPWLLRTASIHWDGRFAQCDADYEGEYSPGDIRYQSIKEVWNGELAKRRERHWQNDFEHPLCRDCKDWSVGRAEFFYHEKE